MKKLALFAAAAAFALTGVARADDKTEEKHEVQKNDNGTVKEQHHSKKKKGKHASDETKVDSDSHARMGGGTVSTTTTTSEHDADGMKNDHKSKTKETVEKDAHGNVVKHEKSSDSK